jgi:hypothetical protein
MRVRTFVLLAWWCLIRERYIDVILICFTSHHHTCWLSLYNINMPIYSKFHIHLQLAINKESEKEKSQRIEYSLYFYRRKEEIKITPNSLHFDMQTICKKFTSPGCLQWFGGLSTCNLVTFSAGVRTLTWFNWSLASNYYNSDTVDLGSFLRAFSKWWRGWDFFRGWHQKLLWDLTEVIKPWDRPNGTERKWVIGLVSDEWAKSYKAT